MKQYISLIVLMLLFVSSSGFCEQISTGSSSDQIKKENKDKPVWFVEPGLYRFNQHINWRSKEKWQPTPRHLDLEAFLDVEAKAPAYFAFTPDGRFVSFETGFNQCEAGTLMYNRVSIHGINESIYDRVDGKKRPSFTFHRGEKNVKGKLLAFFKAHQIHLNELKTPLLLPSLPWHIALHMNERIVPQKKRVAAIDMDIYITQRTQKTTPLAIWRIHPSCNIFDALSEKSDKMTYAELEKTCMRPELGRIFTNEANDRLVLEMLRSHFEFDGACRMNVEASYFMPIEWIWAKYKHLKDEPVASTTIVIDEKAIPKQQVKKKKKKIIAPKKEEKWVEPKKISRYLALQSANSFPLDGLPLFPDRDFPRLFRSCLNMNCDCMDGSEVKREATLYSRMDKTLPAVGHVKPGDAVKLVGTYTLVKQTAEANVRMADGELKRLGYVEGDIIHPVTSLGEGGWRIWHQGQIKDVSNYSGYAWKATRSSQIEYWYHMKKDDLEGYSTDFPFNRCEFSYER